MKIFQVLILILGLSFAVNAQKATLSGEITDKFGAFIPDAKIEAKRKDGKIITTRTKSDGSYSFCLEQGSYQIEVTKIPFEKFVIPIYPVAQYRQMKLDIVLLCPKCNLIEHPIDKTDNKIENIKKRDFKSKFKIL